MIKIRTQFDRAGVIYRWPYKSPGLGIEFHQFLGEGSMTINFQNQTFIVDKELARNEVKRWNSYYNAKGGVRLGVLPLQFLIERQGDRQDKLI